MAESGASGSTSGGAELWGICGNHRVNKPSEGCLHMSPDGNQSQIGLVKLSIASQSLHKIGHKAFDPGSR